MHPVLFKLGPLVIYTYGFFVFLGVAFGYIICSREAKKQEICPEIFSNIFFWVIIFAFLGAKVLYLLIERKYFLAEPLAMIRSGFVFYGGVISGICAVYVLSCKYKISFLKLSDIIVIGVPLAHALGRIGCFFYGCCYGKPTVSWIGVQFPPGSPAGDLGARVIPTQLISAVFLLFIFLTLLMISRKKKFDGQISSYYLIFYGVFRFVIELFRGDPRGYIFGLSTSQFISLILVFLGIILFCLRGILERQK